MSKPTLYYMWESPPCCTVIAIARILNIELDMKHVDLTKKDQNNPEFKKINPFAIVPTFVETDGYTLWESRAISTYLVQSRSPDSTLYPGSDLKKRSTIDKFLQYDLGTFNRAIYDVVSEIFKSGKLNEQNIPRLGEVLKTLEETLAANNESNGGPFITGDDQLTIADISMHFSWTLLSLLPERLIDQSSYPTIRAWNQAVIQALKPYNRDQKFTEAQRRLKAFITMMIESAKNTGAKTK
ncbi:hypothetical protein RDWZM_008502 [Blomia tropicalis]|uniref:Uncharacterized protein n=1 Tax=Blomia tropicalis TaxID=40697 RepID=A0A9Q0RKE3_BLOTA|nr:hypothetical protein RDWZM_008502 [Blomia tropicalis]